MRQVPTSFTSYLVIGSGRMARHFCHYLRLLNLPFTQWSRSTHSHENLLTYCKNASHILFLISDAQIAQFAQKIPKQNNQVLIHFSGNLTIDGIFSTHPLGTFTNALYTLEEYLAVPFVLEENSLPFCELLPGLKNRSYAIPASLKAYYHALCVLSGNFTCILWQKFFYELKNTLQLPQEIGLPYLSQIFQNIKNNPNSALTGPLVRNDEQTIQENLKSLHKDPYYKIYQSFVELFKKEAPHEHI